MNGWLVALGLLVSVACSSSESERTDHIGCHDACDNYRACFDLDYGVAGCTSFCDTAVEEGRATADGVDECVLCIDEACYDEEFPCEAECAEVIEPQDMMSAEPSE